jgi:phenylpyruvate tautomerase PptA (4-oxalocrotonate tautomerase family)
MVMAMPMVTVAVTIAKTKNLKNEQKEKIVNGSN